MGKKRHTVEEIVAKLRQVDVLTAQGRTMALGIPRRLETTQPHSLSGDELFEIRKEHLRPLGGPVESKNHHI